MDWQFKVGFGLTLLFGFLPYVVRDLPHWVTWPGVAVGLLFAFWGVFPGHDKAPLLPTISFVLCCTGAVASAAWFYESISLQRGSIPGSIFVEAKNMTPLPEVYPASGKIDVLYLRPHMMAPGAQRELVVTNNSGVPGAKIEWAKGNSVFSSFASILEITNDTEIPLRELTIPLKISHGAASKGRLIEKILTIVRLDPGPVNRRIFYVVNQTAEGGAITTGNVAAALRLEDSLVRRVRVTLPANPVFQAVLYAPFTETKSTATKSTVKPRK